jgi:RpiR family carbohydrate utilization transcriptional regulator
MLERITASLSSLAPAEQRVGKLVLLDPRSFASLPVTELAARAHVSKPTVVRFCRSILVKVIDNNVAAFLKYRNNASSAAIEKAAGALLNTCILGKRIEFFGAGNSGIVAQDAQHKFFRLGVSTVAYSDGHMQVMSASMMAPGDCVVVISNSGRTRDLMDATDIARKHGATTICITSSGSPLASAAHIHLAADHPEGYDRYSPMTSRLLHLTIIDVLATVVALRMDGAKLLPRLKDIRTNLRSKRYA